MTTRPRWRRLEALRQQAKMSQAEMAERVGISQGYLSQLESVTTQRDCNNPSVGLTLRIANTLDIPIAALLGEMGYPDYADAVTPTQKEVTRLRRIVRWYRAKIDDLATGAEGG